MRPPPRSGLNASVANNLNLWPQQHSQRRTLRVSLWPVSAGIGENRCGREGPWSYPVILLQGLSQSSPSRISQTDQAQAQCIGLSIADFDAGAAVLPCRRGIGLGKLLEQLCLLLSRHADAGVGHGELNPVATVGDPARLQPVAGIAQTLDARSRSRFGKNIRLSSYLANPLSKNQN